MELVGVCGLDRRIDPHKSPCTRARDHSLSLSRLKLPDLVNGVPLPPSLSGQWRKPFMKLEAGET